MTHHHHRGFTLIEMLIAVAIAGVLAAAAYPSFQAPLYKARRIDAISTLLQLQLSQEQWRGDHATYASASELRAAATSHQGYYAIELNDVSSSGYALTATAVGAQAGDTACKVLRLSIADGAATQTAGADVAQLQASDQSRRCWGA